MQKTLGGDRLGSGGNMKVDLHNYGRSTHDLGYIWRSTMSAGTLVPFMVEIALPGDTWDIDLDVDVKTHPTLGPLFGSYKVQLDLFLTPLRLYNSLTHNNMLGIGRDMSKVKLPTIATTARVVTGTTDIDNAQVNPSALLSYLGIRGYGKVTSGTATRKFNGVPFLNYWEIYKNYYANKQEEIGAYINNTVPDNATLTSLKLWQGATSVDIVESPAVSNPNVIAFGDEIEAESASAIYDLANVTFNIAGAGAVNGNVFVENLQQITATKIRGTVNPQYIGFQITSYTYNNGDNPVTVKPIVDTFPLSNIDDMRKAILAYQSETTAFNINSEAIEPYNRINAVSNGIPVELLSQQGLGLKTYQSDLFNNWLSTEWIESVNDISAVSTVGDSFTIDQLNLSKKVYELLNRVMVSGGSFDDWQDAVWAHDRHKRPESPMYMGGLIRELVFQEVVSNSQSETQPLGTLAGKGVMAHKKKGGRIVINVDEPSYIMGIVSLTPRIDYSQGNKWDTSLETFDDLHKPQLDQIGFQDLIEEQMAWWTTEWDGTKWVGQSAGKQPAWINYMTNVNQTRGNFAVSSNEMFMTLNRRFEYDGTGIKDLTTYIDPSKFNFIFAQTSLDSQNFWVQIGIDATARRKMSAKVMPNL